MKYIISRGKGDILALEQMTMIFKHLPYWDIQLIDIVVEPDMFIIALSDNIPKDQEAHLNTEEQKKV